MTLNPNWDRIDDMQDVARREWNESHNAMLADVFGPQVEVKYDVDEVNELYRDLVECGVDEIEAAWRASEICGIVPAVDADPMEPDYHALAREPERGDRWDAAEGPAVQ